MENQDVISIDLQLHKEIKQAGINIIFSVPCAMLKRLIDVINEKQTIRHVPVTREEEAVGVAAGAYMGGLCPMILMQNSGLGNSVNAIKSLLEVYEIPLVFMMSHRGAEGEKIKAQVPMGKLTPDLLDAVGIEKLFVRKEEDLQTIHEKIVDNLGNGKSLAIILSRPLWEGS